MGLVEEVDVIERHIDRVKKRLNIESGSSLVVLYRKVDQEYYEIVIQNLDGIAVAYGLSGSSVNEELMLMRARKQHPVAGLLLADNLGEGELRAYRRSYSSDSLTKLTSIPSLAPMQGLDFGDKLDSVPLGKGLENILFEAHSHLRDIDGLHADIALDEICKIIFAKIYDELQGGQNFSSRLGVIDETSAVIRQLYLNAINHFSDKSEGHKTDVGTSVFNYGIMLSAAALNKVVSEFEYLDLSNSPVDIKGRAFQNLISPALRAGMGQYFTPKEIITLVVSCIDPSPSEKVIDPFCGSAHFLSECVLHTSSKTDSNQREYVERNLFGIDKSEKMIRVGLTDMLLMDGDTPNLIHSDALLDFENYTEIEPSSFDIVVTNPPFGSVLGQESFDSIGNFELLKGRKSAPLEVIGLERSIQLLKDGGRLAIVLPDSIFLNKSSDYIRDWLSNNVQVKGVLSLPSETFSPFGANVKTSILICVKRKSSAPYNTFMATLQDIGYDASGRQNGKGDDLREVAKEFQEFIVREGW